MSRSIVLRANNVGIEKPWSLVIRSHDLSGTDYETICHLNDDVAQLMADEGISWLFGEPDWDKHYKEIDRRRTARDLKEAKAKVEELEAKASL